MVQKVQECLGISDAGLAKQIVSVQRKLTALGRRDPELEEKLIGLLKRAKQASQAPVD